MKINKLSICLVCLITSFSLSATVDFLEIDNMNLNYSKKEFQFFIEHLYKLFFNSKQTYMIKVSEYKSIKELLNFCSSLKIFVGLNSLPKSLRLLNQLENFVVRLLFKKVSIISGNLL